MAYERIVRQALTTPWLITSEYGGIIYDLLRFRAAGGRLTPEALRERIASRQRPRRDVARATAVIPIWGVIANRNFDASSGMTSIEAIRPAFQRALADDDIGAIVLDINSPGGTVPGVPEFAAEVYAARKVKPVTAFVDDLCASAAYWIASACSRIVAIPSGDVGSIGVYMLHVSEKAHLEKEGIKVTPISYGENKLEGAPWDDLSPETLAFLKGQVNEIGRQFDAAVARGRGVGVARVREAFGQGRVFSAKEALALGMIDSIGGFAHALSTPAGGGALALSAEAIGPAPSSFDVTPAVAAKPTAPKARVRTYRGSYGVRTEYEVPTAPRRYSAAYGPSIVPGPFGGTYFGNEWLCRDAAARRLDNEYETFIGHAGAWGLGCVDGRAGLLRDEWRTNAQGLVSQYCELWLDHNRDWWLGSNADGTLALDVDAHGVRFIARVHRSRIPGSSLEQGVVTGVSIGLDLETEELLEISLITTRGGGAAIGSWAERDSLAARRRMDDTVRLAKQQFWRSVA